ncbi:hypothetical protein D3C72_1697080 [compost metagenome]
MLGFLMGGLGFVGFDAQLLDQRHVFKPQSDGIERHTRAVAPLGGEGCHVNDRNQGHGGVGRVGHQPQLQAQTGQRAGGEGNEHRHHHTGHGHGVGGDAGHDRHHQSGPYHGGRVQSCPSQPRPDGSVEAVDGDQNPHVTDRRGLGQIAAQRVPCVKYVDQPRHHHRGSPHPQTQSIAGVGHHPQHNGQQRKDGE